MLACLAIFRILKAGGFLLIANPAPQSSVTQPSHIVLSFNPSSFIAVPSTMTKSSYEKEAGVTATVEHGVKPGAAPADVLDLDSRIQELAAAAPPFHRNPNLFKLYALIVPSCLAAAITLGFDASMMSGLQAVPAWDNCEFSLPASEPAAD
jgi:hypothetical protein